MSQMEALREEISWMRADLANKSAEIARLKGNLKVLEMGLGHFVDDSNWNERIGCLQWVGKRHPIGYALDVLEGLSSPIFIGRPTSAQPSPERVQWQLAELEEAMRQIRLRASGGGEGDRTFDECLKDLGWIDDECRRLTAQTAPDAPVERFDDGTRDGTRK